MVLSRKRVGSALRLRVSCPGNLLRHDLRHSRLVSELAAPSSRSLHDAMLSDHTHRAARGLLLLAGASVPRRNTRAC